MWQFQKLSLKESHTETGQFFLCSFSLALRNPETTILAQNNKGHTSGIGKLELEGNWLFEGGESQLISPAKLFIETERNFCY